MNPTLSSVVVLLALCVVLIGCVAQAGPAGAYGTEAEEAGPEGPAMDESAAVDPEFNALTSDESGSRSGDDDEASSANSQSEASLDGADSNIADAKVHLGAQDMTAAAGHHYEGHGHGVSGKMEMGAHTDKKGAFGWHAKFPVGGKGRR